MKLWTSARDSFDMAACPVGRGHLPVRTYSCMLMLRLVIYCLAVHRSTKSACLLVYQGITYIVLDCTICTPIVGSVILPSLFPCMDSHQDQENAEFQVETLISKGSSVASAHRR